MAYFEGDPFIPRALRRDPHPLLRDNFRNFTHILMQ